MQSEKAKTVKIEISLKSLLLIIGVLIGTFFIFSVRNVIFMLFWGFILSSALLPAIKKLSKSRYISHGLSVAIVYISLILFTLTLLILVSVPLVRETVKLAERTPEILNELIEILNRLGVKLGVGTFIDPGQETQMIIEKMSENFLSNLSNIFSAGANSLTVAYELLEKLFGGIFNIVTSLTLSIYISIDHKNFVKALLRTLPKQNTRQKIGTLIDKIETQLGHWIASQALLSLIVAGMSWIVLTILGVPFTLPLAILVLLLNSIPSIGATAAAIPAVLVAISTGNIIQIIGVPIGYVFIQQIENNYLAPKIMSNAIGLPPIIIILALLIGAELGGILGILMAIPLSGIIHVTIDYWLELKQKE